MDAPSERQLAANWAPELVVLSYCISWLGAYTSTQIMIHANYTRSRLMKWLWIFLSSVAFGFCAIWSMHFVGMLACRLDVDIHFDVPLTILSAVVAVLFTFAALSSAYATKSTGNSGFSRWLRSVGLTLRFAHLPSWKPPRSPDIETGYVILNGSETHEENELGASTRLSMSRSHEDDEDNEGIYEHEDTWEEDEQRLAFESRISAAPVVGHEHDTPMPESGISSSSCVNPRPDAVIFTSLNFRRTNSPPSKPLQIPVAARASVRPAMQAIGVQHDSQSISNSESSDSLLTRNLSGTTLGSWSDSLHNGLSRETRLRIKAMARDKPLPTFGWQYWVKQHWEVLSLFLAVRAAMWAVAIVFMHYCGMWAMEIPDGRIAWSFRTVVLSYVVAFLVCLVGCVAMVHMEMHFGRQVAFSTITSTGICSMHYTGMAAATFYTRLPPSPTAGYPTYLPVSIICVAVVVCVISNAVLAHAAISARNRMAEMILTKRRLWRIMAEKEAAEQANELKQQFISVASHEIRTPLHTVNGYCELLTRTNLTQEQKLYVTSIQQACHAINLIAGNVLDFSKLDRNNTELSARPVLMELRKMVEDVARITESKGVQPGQQGVDVIISVADDVPHSVYLDETYTFRILMNLLSNAQKFCDTGFICIMIYTESPSQVVITVSDSGCGIPNSFRSSLFEPFRQAQSPASAPHQGTGLGLSIVKHLVQRMSGSIDVDSTEGEGTTFTVRFPLTSPPHSSADTPTPSPASKPDHRKRITVVYRNKRTEDLYVQLWSQRGFPTTAVSGNSPTPELTRDADAIWTDVESVSRSASLQALMQSVREPVLPIFLVHSDVQELAALEPLLSAAQNVVLVKRPIVIGTVATLIDDPAKHLQVPVSSSGHSKVHFAVQQDHGDESSLVLQEGVGKKEPSLIDTLPELVQSHLAPEKQTILLVEDNQVNQHLGQRLLEKLGYKVITANDGQQALEIVTKTSLYCCLMDCQMPVMDGFTATRKIRELEVNGNIPGRLLIIALTANVTPESEGECRAAGMDIFLPKPINFSVLESVLALQGSTPQ